MIRAVFMDLDGTLLDCANGKSGISARSRGVFRRLKEQGIALFVASGRSVSFIPEAVRGAGFDGYVLANGAEIWAGDHVVAAHTLDPELMRRITQDLEQEKIEYALQIPGGTWMSRKREHILPYFKEYLFDERFLTESPLAECLDRVMKLELYVFPEQYERCREILEPLDMMYTPKTHGLEAYSRNVSKGTGTAEILRHFDIGQDESMCFGDEQNDLEMFRSAGWAVAMGNACEAVKGQADDVCGCVGEDGVAAYLEQWFYINQIK